MSREANATRLFNESLFNFRELRADVKSSPPGHMWKQNDLSDMNIIRIHLSGHTAPHTHMPLVKSSPFARLPPMFSA